MSNQTVSPSNGTILIKFNEQDSDEHSLKKGGLGYFDIQKDILPLYYLRSDDSNLTIKETKEERYFQIANINMLESLRLKKPMSISIEFDEIYYIAKSLDLPIYAVGEDSKEAVVNLKMELEEVYYELIEDDNFSEEWLKYKELLKNFVAD